MAEPGARGTRLQRARTFAATPDGRAVLVLVALPIVVFALPAAFGWPAITGDNAIQNFPLRVFSGQLLRQGHLPLWNPYIWSGSPLLGGLNAGSLYPFTLLFAAVPATLAWVLNLLGAYWAGGLGLYALARQFRLAPLAALLAALTYAFGGAMVGQLVHLPVVEGMGWIPLMVLAQVRLAWVVFKTGPAPPDGGRPTPVGRSPWPWVTLLAGAIGLILLAGEPRGMAEAELVATPFALWLALQRYGGVTVTWRARAAYLGHSAFGALWAVAIGAIQLLPGWEFITTSQRGTETYSFLTAGSLRPGWSVLLLDPAIFGGNGLLHQPVYFNSYNLAEVTGYVGLLPLVGFVVLALRSVGKRRDSRTLEYVPWFFLAVFGLLLSFGQFTPLGQVFVHVPFYSKVRLPARSLGIVDLALAVLFAFWLDGLLARRPATGWLVRPWRERASQLAIPVAALTLCVVAFAWPVSFQGTFSRDGGATNIGSLLRPWLAVQGVVGIGLGALVLGWRRLPPRAARVLLVAAVVCDLGLFNLTAATGYLTQDRPVIPTAAAVTAVVGSRGRFAIFDTTASRVTQLIGVGQPDVNSVTRVPSVQGYGSLVGNSYGNATFSHALDTLSACALQSGVFTPLRLGTLLTVSQFLAPPVGSDGVPSPIYGSPPPHCPGAPPPAHGGRRTFYLGQDLTLQSVTLGETGRPARAAALRVGVLDGTGAVSWPAEHIVGQNRSWQVRFDSPTPAFGVVVSGPAAQVADDSTVRSSGGQVFTLDGEIQDALDVPGWRMDGIWQGYSRFVRTTVRPPVWVAGPADGARVRQLSSTDWGSQTDALRTAHPVTVVRSEAYLAGWRVVATPAHGPVRTLAVRADGLVQSVRVPAGDWTLTFLYRPKGLTEAAAASVLGVAGLAGAGALGWRARRRRRPTVSVH